MKKELKFLCWYCKGEFSSNLYKEKDGFLEVVCPFCEAVCVAKQPTENEEFLQESKPLKTVEPSKKKELE